MPATAGRVRMPANNRLSVSDSLRTSEIWQKSVGYDPYAPDGHGGPTEGHVAGPGAEINDKARSLFVLARLTGSISSITPGACRKCGQIGHLAFQCRNNVVLSNASRCLSKADDQDDEESDDDGPPTAAEKVNPSVVPSSDRVERRRWPSTSSSSSGEEDRRQKLKKERRRKSRRDGKSKRRSRRSDSSDSDDHRRRRRSSNRSRRRSDRRSRSPIHRHHRD